MEFRFLLEVGGARFHSGPGDLTLGADTYHGDHVLGIGPAEGEVDEPNTRLQLQLRDHPDLAGIAAPLLCRLAWIQRTGPGAAWVRVANLRRGLLSQPSREADQVTLLLEPDSGTVDRGDPRTWSADAQAARNPGDLGFEGLPAIANGRQPSWPKR